MAKNTKNTPKKNPPKKDNLTKEQRYTRNMKIYKMFVEDRTKESDVKSSEIIGNVAKKFKLSYFFVRSVIYLRSKWMTEIDYKANS